MHYEKIVKKRASELKLFAQILVNFNAKFWVIYCTKTELIIS